MNIRTIVTGVLLLAAPEPALAQNREALCGLLTPPAENHLAGADYVPGVDVHGKPVVPADLGAPANVLPDVIRIPVTQDLAQGLGQPLPQGMELKADLGMIEISRDGSVTMNGRNIGAQARALCGLEAAGGQGQSPSGAETLNHDKPLTAGPEPTSPPHALKPVEEDVIWGEGH